MATTARVADGTPPSPSEGADVAIAPDPHRPGVERARLVDAGVAVWAIIGYMGGEDGDVAQTAAAYGIPEAAVRAAIAYYRLHRAAAT